MPPGGVDVGSGAVRWNSTDDDVAPTAFTSRLIQSEPFGLSGTDPDGEQNGELYPPVVRRRPPAPRRLMRWASVAGHRDKVDRRPSL